MKSLLQSVTFEKAFCKPVSPLAQFGPSLPHLGACSVLFCDWVQRSREKSFCLQEKVWAYVMFSYPLLLRPAHQETTFISLVHQKKNDIIWRETKTKLKTTFLNQSQQVNPYWLVLLGFFSLTHSTSCKCYILFYHILWVMEPNQLETTLRCDLQQFALIQWKA